MLSSTSPLSHSRMANTLTPATPLPSPPLHLYHTSSAPLTSPHSEYMVHQAHEWTDTHTCIHAHIYMHTHTYTHACVHANTTAGQSRCHQIHTNVISYLCRHIPSKGTKHSYTHNLFPPNPPQRKGVPKITELYQSRHKSTYTRACTE